MHLSFCKFRDLLTSVHMSFLAKLVHVHVCICLEKQQRNSCPTASPQSSSSYTQQYDYFHLVMQNTLHVVTQKQDMFVASAARETH